MVTVKRKIQALVFSVSSILLLLGTSLPVHAAFPGQNGNIAWTDFRFDPTTFEPTVAGLFTVDFGGGTDQPLATYPTFAAMPTAARYSADGSKLAYEELNPDTGESDVFVADINATNSVNVSQINRSAFPDRSVFGADYPSFSPDGSKVIYSERWTEDVGNGDEWFCHLITNNLAGTARTELTNDPNLCDTGAVFSPDGSKIAFLRNNKTTHTTSIYLMNADGSGPTELAQLTSGDLNPTKLGFSAPVVDEAASLIDWSPDGSKLVFATYKFNDQTDHMITSTISTVNMDGTVTVVANFTAEQFDSIETAGRYTNAAYLNPQFTPEGQIIFRYIEDSVDRADDGDGEWISQNETGTSYLRVMNADGSNLRTIAQSAILSGEQAGYMLYSFLIPTVRPIASTATITSDSQALATTGINLYVWQLFAVAMCLTFAALWWYRHRVQL